MIEQFHAGNSERQRDKQNNVKRKLWHTNNEGLFGVVIGMKERQNNCFWNVIQP